MKLLPMYTARVKETKKQYSPADNDDTLVVTVEVLDDEGEVVEERVFGYLLGATEEYIKTDLQKFVATYNIEQEQKEANAARDKAQEELDKTAENLQGLEFSNKTVEDKSNGK